MTTLLDLLRERSYRKGTVKLASGKLSDFYIDCKQTVLTAQGHTLVGEEMFKAIQALSFKPEAVAGVELGGCPLASAVSLVSYQKGAPLDAVYVRKSVKDHGSTRWLEGDDKLSEGASIVVVEDVITTGGSTLRAVERIKARGLHVPGVVVLVDRMEGGREALQNAGLEVHALYTRRDFV